LKAYALGCKGCTTYRPSGVRGAVLEAREPGRDLPLRTSAPIPAPIENPAEPSLPLPLPSPKPREQGGVVYMTQPLDRPEVLLGQTYKIKWADSDHAFYITINDIQADGRRRPFEIFINSKNMEAYAWTLGLTRMISAVFRRGGDVSFVVDELKAVFDPRGGQWMSGRYVPSLLAAIGEVIERHMIATGFMTPREAIVPEEVRALAVNAEGVPAKPCPRCSSPSFVKIEACDTCLACGYSRCA
jgi:ribonucleoside-diphosphate reductase alpha chain